MNKEYFNDSYHEADIALTYFYQMGYDAYNKPKALEALARHKKWLAKMEEYIHSV